MTSGAEAASPGNPAQGLHQHAFPGNAAVLPPVRAAQQAAGGSLAKSGIPASSSTSGDLQPQQWRARPVGGSREAWSDSTTSDNSATAKRLTWHRQVQGVERLAQDSAPHPRGFAAPTTGTKRKREHGANPFSQAGHSRPRQVAVGNMGADHAAAAGEQSAASAPLYAHL